MASDEARVLSAGEQVLVLRHLSRTFRSGVVLIRVLAALQLLLSFLYLCLIVMGYPLVFVSFDDEPSTINAPHESGSLTRCGVAAIAMSAALLAIAGMCDMRSCRGVLYVHPSLPDVGSHTDHFCLASRGTLAENSAGSSAPNRPRHQFVIALLAVFPTAYWLYALVSYQRHLAEKGVQQSGFSWSWRELFVVLWQPVAHAMFGMLLESMILAKEDLISLAHMKYE